MDLLNRTCLVVLIVTCLSIQLPNGALAGQSYLIAQSVTITEHSPEMLAPPELEIPLEPLPVKKKKSKKWLWAVLGAALLGGIAAVAAGGGGGGDGGGDGGTGGINVGW